MSSLLIASGMLASLKKQHEEEAFGCSCLFRRSPGLACSLSSPPQGKRRSSRFFSSEYIPSDPCLSQNQIDLLASYCLQRHEIDLLTRLTHLSEPTRSGSLSRRSVGRSIDRLRGSCLASLYSLAKQVCFASCFVVWRNGSLIHGSRGFAETEREWAWSGCSQLILLVAAADVWYSCREREILRWVWSGRCVSLQPILLLVAGV